ncbi:hypothetical protein HQ531_10565 [bacterium]|nr:hypothetical protein [bacterium]
MKRNLLILIILSLITINPRINGWNEASRMALTQSLVEQQSFVIEESIFINTGDKVRVNGHFYSDKPTFPSLLAALAYWPLYKIGLKLDYGWSICYYLIILMTIKVFWIASVLTFRAALKYTSARVEDYDFLTLLYTITSLTFTWSATFNNHSLAASSLMIAFMFYLKAKQEKTLLPFIYSGLFFGLAAVSDMPTGIFLAGFAILVFKKWSLNLRTLGFVISALVPLSIHFSINYSIGNTFVPLQIVPEFLDYEGSVWLNSNVVTGIRVNSPLFSLKYAFACLIGPRGFLWYNPMLLLIFPILLRNTRPGKQLQRESVVILVSSVILMCYYFLFSSNFGGYSYSIRWFVPLLPLIYFHLHDFRLNIQKSNQQALIFSLMAVSIIIALVGQINPWSNLSFHPIPFLANLQQLASFLF